jgi:hypothetical protein
VYRGANGSYALYEDDGVSQDYLRGRGSSFTRFLWNDRTKQLTIESGGPARSFNVQMLPENVTKSVKYAGQRMTVTF